MHALVNFQLILTSTYLHFAHSQKFTVTFITKMCLSPAHFHQFLHPSIETHYEGPAKYGMIVEIQGHPKHLLMPNSLGLVKNVPQTITIFVDVPIFLWAYIVYPYKISCGRTWAYVGVLGVLGVICGRTGLTWAYKGIHWRNIAGAVFFNFL